MSKRKRPRVGESPGTPIYTGNLPAVNPDVTIIWYAPDTYNEQFQQGLHCKLPNQVANTWYDVRGVSDAHVVENIAQTFHIPTLAIEDITDVNQRPKIDDYENGLFFIAREMIYESATNRIRSEQISFFLGNNFVLSFQEDADDLFTLVRERLKNERGRLRQKSVDYLAYALLDSIVDGYFPILDTLEDKIERLEGIVLENVDQVDRKEIYHLKKQILEMRRVVMPLREVLHRFSVAESPFISDENMLFFRDLKDHIQQIADITDSLRDMILDLQSIYHIEREKKTAHVMKVLTVVSAIFIPLTFIVGVYGTNFKNLPELEYHYAYQTMWAVMILIAIILLIIFKRRKWI